MTAFDEFFMRMALSEAEKAAHDGETPLGCVIVKPKVVEESHDGHEALYDFNPSTAQILSRAHNMTESLQEATAHAEMLALSGAFSACGSWRLNGARLYVTKEPCPMCAGAIVLSRLDKIVWGVSDEKRGGETVFGILSHPGVNHHPQFEKGLCEEESKSLLQNFFRSRRA